MEDKDPQPSTEPQVLTEAAQSEEEAKADAAAKHIEMLTANHEALTETTNDIGNKIAALKDAPSGDVVELDRQVTQAHGILSAVHDRIRTLLGEDKAAA